MSILSRIAYRLRLVPHPYSQRELAAYWLGAFRKVKDEHMEEMEALVLKVWIEADRPSATGREWRPRKQVTLMGEGGAILLCSDADVRWVAVYDPAGARWNVVRERSQGSASLIPPAWVPENGDPSCFMMEGIGHLEAVWEKVEAPVVEQREIREVGDKLWALSAMVRSSDLAKVLIDHGGWFRREGKRFYVAAKLALVKSLEQGAERLARQGFLHRMVLPQEEVWQQDPDGCWMLTEDGFAALLAAHGT